MTSSNSQTKKKQTLNMGDVLAKETEQAKSSVEDETWDNREDADGASSVEDSIIRDLQERLSLTVGASDDNYESDDSGTQCDCDACQEPIMSIRNPHFDRVQEHWQKLRMFIQIVYKQAVDGKELDPEYREQIQTIIHELVTLEPHLLYKQLEAQIQEWVIETELRQLESLLITDNVDTIPHRFISGLLESYKNLMVGAELAFPILEELQATHLSKFNMTWELLNEHIYQSCVYADPLVQNNVPIFIGKLSNTSESMECNKELVKEFLYLDDSINSVAEQWVLCKRGLEAYSQDQAVVQGRRTLLEMEWRCFKAEENNKNSEKNCIQSKVLCKKKTSGDTNSSQSSNKCSMSSCDCMKTPQSEVHDYRPLSPSSLASCRKSTGTPAAPPTANNLKTCPEGPSPQVTHSDIDERVLSSSTQPPASRVNQSSSTVSHSHTHTHVNSGVKGTSTTCNKPVHKITKPEDQGITPPTKCRSKQQQASNCAPRTSCHKNRAGCSHHKHDNIKRAPHRPNSGAAHEEEDSDSCSSCTPPDDSASDRSSLSNQKSSGSSDPRHCDCCYCEVFGHGVPSGAPVSRNYQEIRERLRLLLNKKKNSSKKQAVAAAAVVSSTSESTACSQHRGLFNGKPNHQAQIPQSTPAQSSTAFKGDENLSDILNFIEGKTSKDSKKAAKKARQKEKKLQEMYQRKLEEEAAERAKLEAEKRRKLELLEEKERLIREQQRLERELQKQNQILNNNLKALSVKNNNNESNISNNSKKGKKGKQQQQNNKKLQQQQQQVDAASSKKNKKKNKKGGDISPPVQPSPTPNSNGEGGDVPKIVTIKRVMEPSGSEPTVTITLRGATPSQDKVLYTLQNGHGCSIEEKKRQAAAAVLNNSNNKKLGARAAPTHVQHTPGVVEISVNGGSSKPATLSLPSGKLVKNTKAPVTIRTAQIGDPMGPSIRLPSGGVGIPPSAGFSSMSVVNLGKSKLSSLPPSSGVARNTPPLPPPQLTSSTAIQISNAISSLTSSGGADFNIEDLQLPPGITITKVVPPPLVNGNYEETSASSSLSCDGGDMDHLNKENTNLNGNPEAPLSKKSRKKRNKQKQQQLLLEQQQQNGELIPNRNITAQGQGDPDGAVFKVKGSMVTIRNPSVFPSEQTHGVVKRKDLPARPDDWNLVDEESVFAPKDIDLDNGDIDDAERELEAFKRFCSQSVPPKQKEKVHLNIKDIVLKKKRAAISCS